MIQLKKYLLRVCVLLILTSCSYDSEKRQAKTFVKSLQKEISQIDTFSYEEYFTPIGWQSFSRLFQGDEELKEFGTYFSKLKIRGVERYDDDRIYIAIGSSDPVAGRSGLVLQKFEGSFKVVEYRGAK